MEENNKALGEIIMNEKHMKMTKETVKDAAAATGSNDKSSSSCNNNVGDTDNKGSSVHKDNGE